MILVELQSALPPAFSFEDLVREIRQVEIPWARHYREYQSGGWWTCTLLGQSWDAMDGQVTDVVRPVATGALERLPVTCNLLGELGWQYMTVRLARLDPDGALWEHKDYQDLKRTPRHRIHLPIETNPGASLVSSGGRFHMGAGSLWMFRPTMAHGAINAGDGNRIHLMIDVYEDEKLKQILGHATPLSSSSLPDISAKDLRELVRSLCGTGRHTVRSTGSGSESLTEQECAVLRLYFEFAVPEGALYSALEQAYANDGHTERAAFWSARRNLMLGNGIIEHD